MALFSELLKRGFYQKQRTQRTLEKYVSNATNAADATAKTQG